VQSEFDKYAYDYDEIHQDAIRASGYQIDYFYEYKVKEMHRVLSKCDIKTPLHGNPMKILDFGCGVGNLDPYIREYFPEANIYGYDISEESVSIAREKHKKESIIYSVYDNVTYSFPMDSMFDIVIASCVFHHIPPQEHIKALSCIWSNMCPGGSLFIFEHNPINPATRAVFHKNILDERAILVSSRNIKKKLEQCGFERARINYTVFFPKALSFFAPLERYISAIPFGAQYYTVAVKP